MAEYINREKIFPNGVFYVNKNQPEKSLDELINRICKAPAADVVEVVHGEWVHIKDYGGGNCSGHCSVCWTLQEADNPSALKGSFRYCRWCGAKMDGENNE